MSFPADDIPLYKPEDKPIMLPFGAVWESIEDFWSDLVSELGEIPFGANEYFHNVLEPKLGAV